jgi:hypothetical protein
MKRQETIGIAFFREEDWPAFLESADDRDELEETWEQWLSNVRRTEDQLDRLRIKYREVVLNVDELLGFCAKKGLPNDSESRAAFLESKMEGPGKKGK